jgi:hypothetical protein
MKAKLRSEKTLDCLRQHARIQVSVKSEDSK